MYFLNDKHNIYDYGLYCCVSGGLPYIKYTSSDFNILMNYIKEIEKKHNHYNQSFYIDNSFYKNDYDKNFSNIYYKVLRRKINDWEEFDLNNDFIFLNNFQNKY